MFFILCLNKTFGISSRVLLFSHLIAIDHREQVMMIIVLANNNRLLHIPKSNLIGLWLCSRHQLVPKAVTSVFTLPEDM